MVDDAKPPRPLVSSHSRDFEASGQISASFVISIIMLFQQYRLVPAFILTKRVGLCSYAEVRADSACNPIRANVDSTRLGSPQSLQPTFLTGITERSLARIERTSCEKFEGLILA